MRVLLLVRNDKFVNGPIKTVWERLDNVTVRGVWKRDTQRICVLTQWVGEIYPKYWHSTSITSFMNDPLILPRLTKVFFSQKNRESFYSTRIPTLLAVTIRKRDNLLVNFKWRINFHFSFPPLHPFTVVSFDLGTKFEIKSSRWRNSIPMCFFIIQLVAVAKFKCEKFCLI